MPVCSSTSILLLSPTLRWEIQAVWGTFQLLWRNPHNPVTGLTAASDISPFIASGKVWKNKEKKLGTQKKERFEDERLRDHFWERWTATETEHKAKQFTRLYIVFRKQNSDRKESWNLTMHHYVFYSSCTKKKEEKISQNQCSYLKGKLTDKNRTKFSDSQEKTQLTVYYYQRGTMVFSQN